MTTTAAHAPSAFRRELLPLPANFYQRELHKLSRASRGWVKALCPFHPDKHPSLSISLVSGGFFCFSCGAKGGSVIDFLMLRDGVDFRNAALMLGAWQPEATSRTARADLRRRQVERDRRSRAVDDLLAAEKTLRLQYLAAIRDLEASQRNAAERLNDPAIGVPESEDCWERLQVSLTGLRRALAAYHLLTFGPVAERAEFIQHPDLREAAIQSVLGCGFVRDDDGRVMEVVMP